MKRKTKLALLIGTVLILLPLIAYEFFLWSAWDFSPHYFAADRCLDHGGCWDSIDTICRKDEPDAQALCNRSKKK